ncbi:hypothetical protein ACWDA7_27890 [Streptomyces sp. NPDC001156]
MPAEDAQALLEVRQGGFWFAQREMGEADVAVRGVADDDVTDPLTDLQAPAVGPPSSDRAAG